MGSHDHPEGKGDQEGQKSVIKTEDDSQKSQSKQSSESAVGSVVKHACEPSTPEAGLGV